MLPPDFREIPLVRRRRIMHVVHAHGHEGLFARGAEFLEKVAKRVTARRVFQSQLFVPGIGLADLCRIIIPAGAGAEQISGHVGRTRDDDFVDVPPEVGRQRAQRAVAVVIQQNPFWRLSLGGQNQCGQKDEKRKRMR